MKALKEEAAAATQERFELLNAALGGMLVGHVLHAKNEDLASDQGTEDYARKMVLRLERSEARLRKAWPGAPEKLLAVWTASLQRLGLEEDQGSAADHAKAKLAEHLACKNLVLSPEASLLLAAQKQEAPAVHVDF
jgi:arginyl-tRNA synthetase